ncbi:23S rRNA (adenine2030-N6)-methyltransferase [Kaistia soli DSM 19436]|uniref:Ribosomal RNA large subunit methyltransferase J n=1 Tax=Kaistia soli DSM 19436 TaxID=1122133 RepID=A0A1M4U8W7_9HYPH|nr:23S rRNA (adenine(2030)-N(6))-methyltransferase RlmJ [Kaistia soli]SHE53291.1 23S rRNA (adenine2030-N6)-methyltransferase [Kaistia soli DSM 19436]
MNYRHAYHAGNFADVVKHAVLALLIERLKAKDKGFRVIDSHAGIGLYDLTSPLAAKTGEWERGVGKLVGPDLKAVMLSAKLADALAPYLAAIRAVNPDGRLRFYPGSPMIARVLMREVDRLTAVELNSDDAKLLMSRFAGDIQVKAIELDGYLALGSFVPPKERRGLVLVDPPYEEQNEFRTLADGFLKAYERWPTGVYALWYPVKDLGAVKNFHKRLHDSGVQRLLGAELWVRDRATPDTFNGTGLVLCNPPWKLEDTLESLLAGLVPLLGEDSGAGRRVWWIRAEEAPAR